MNRILTNNKAGNSSSVASWRGYSHVTETKLFTSYKRVLCCESVTTSDINLRIVCDNHLVCSKRYNINYTSNIKIIQLTTYVEQVAI
jgi:hypothetical protein